MATKANEQHFRRPEQLLEELGIDHPSQLNIEAIAFHCGALITYEPLTGCEASIVGSGDRAIITVNNRSARGRQRFSAGHELGHWMRDRGQAAFGCTNKEIEEEWTSLSAEARANSFASDLLLPTKLFVPLAKKRPIILETVRDLASNFQMSLTATAIKLIRCGFFPSMLVFYNNCERKWFIPTDGLPRSLFPRSVPDKRSVTMRLFCSGSNQAVADDVRADHLFDVQGSERYYVRESAFRVADDCAVSLIWWKDEQQIIDLEAEEERRSGRRSDWRPED
jgi:hypothetical protein